MQGGFSVQLGSQNPFDRIPVDQTIEENHSTEIHRQQEAHMAIAWIGLLWRGITSLLSTVVCTWGTSEKWWDAEWVDHLSHTDLYMPRITRDEADVQSIVKLLEDDWTNPFDPNESEFVSISTGTLAPPEVVRDILEVPKIGMAAYKEFKRDRLEDERPEAQLHHKITKKKLKTLSDIRKKTSASNCIHVNLTEAEWLSFFSPTDDARTYPLTGNGFRTLRATHVPHTV